jgi:hypothetical protein
MPTIEEWRNFLVGARTESPGAAVWQSEAAGESPRLSVPEWRTDVFWTDGGVRGLVTRTRPAQLAAAAALLAAAPFGLYAFKWSAAIIDEFTLQPVLEAAREESQSWIALSRRASRDAQVAAQSAELGNSGSLLLAFEQFGQALENEPSFVQQIKLDGDSMQITLDAPPKQDLVALVSRLEAASAWRNVRMESEGRIIQGEIAASAPVANEKEGAVK